jgi:exonuclease III
MKIEHFKIATPYLPKGQYSHAKTATKRYDCTQSTFQHIFNKVKMNNTALIGDLYVKTKSEKEGLKYVIM